MNGYMLYLLIVSGAVCFLRVWQIVKAVADIDRGIDGHSPANGPSAQQNTICNSAHRQLLCALSDNIQHPGDWTAAEEPAGGEHAAAPELQHIIDVPGRA
jgi:hypothetical protein